jgi:hypothetical protein
MRIEQRDGEFAVRQIGAAVVRSEAAGVVVELGPADGPPLTRLILTKSEATQLGSVLRRVLGGRKEQVILIEE